MPIKDIVVLKVDRSAYWRFVGYLENHESDIHHGINDFDALRPIFIELLARHPA